MLAVRAKSQSFQALQVLKVPGATRLDQWLSWDIEALSAYMDFNFTVPFTQLQLLLRRNVLISKEHHAPFRNQKTKLVLLLVGKILQLQTNNLSTDVSC